MTRESRPEANENLPPPWLGGELARHALLSTAEMSRADAAAIAGGVAGTALMEAAGAAVARAIVLRWKKRPAVVLCGPGNNGGDGFVAARHLAAAGWDVRVALLGDRARLKGDAARAASQWTGPIEPLAAPVFEGRLLVVDALFGAGLDRPIEGAARAALNHAAHSGLPVLAVDVPSGVSGDTGAILGAAAPAQLTVTFFRKKPGHLLLPGRALCGPVTVADIGIPASVLESIGTATAENHPDLWRSARPALDPKDHKYSRGHVVLMAGAMAGAARLSALGAARIGAGMVTVLAPPEIIGALAELPAALVVAPLPPQSDLGAQAQSRKWRAVLIGPGLGQHSRSLVEAALGLGLPCVLDADALTAFAGRARDLAALRKGPLIVTPHEGEFTRLFGVEIGDDRLGRARQAASELGGIVVLKGSDTVVTAPDGRAVINSNAPPWLASAGAGDVLAGLILGLVGQGMPAFEAACAAAWLHGASARSLGPGLIADDLPAALPVLW